ncbi:MAG: tetratricopeptide repeat protein [bacterium]|nr:tetratricopeptide repeat protein [bacterium]
MNKGSHILLIPLITSAAFLAALPSRASWFSLRNQAKKHMELGRYAAELRDFERAAQHYERALQENPRSKPIFFTLGALYCKLGQHEKAEQLYRQLVSIYPFDADARLCLGSVFLALDRPTDALQQFEQAAHLNRNDDRAFRNRGFAEFLLGHHVNALKSLQRAAELNPTNALTFYDIGMVLFMLHRTNDACRALRTGLALKPSAEARRSYTDLLEACAGQTLRAAQQAYRSNDFPRAEQLFSHLAQLYPDYALVHAYAGHVYHHQKPAKFQQAEAAYRRALAARSLTVLPPLDYALVLDNLGMIRFNLGDYDEAEQLWRRGVLLDTDYPVIYFNYGLALARRGLYDAAAVAFADAARRDPAFVTYVNHHAALENFRTTPAYSNLLATFARELLTPTPR